MLVTRSLFQEVIKELRKPKLYAVDTETFGLRWFDKHGLFSIIIADESKEYYFNFLDAPDHTGFKPDDEKILPISYKEDLKQVFHNPDSKWFMHNAKFDMGMLAKDGLLPIGKIHCTLVAARLCDSDQFRYNLASCMERMSKELGESIPQKSDIVYEYIKSKKLFTEVSIPGKTALQKDLRFDLVPLEILLPYGLADARATYVLGKYQLKKLGQHRAKEPKIVDVYELEKKITRVVFDMEREGLPLDIEYTKKSLEKLQPVLTRLEKEYKAYTGFALVDSGKNHEPYFKAQGLPITYSDDGTPTFDKAVLKSFDQDPVARLLLEYRKASKLAGTYYSSYLHYVGSDGCIHPSYMQSVKTGRFSMMDPNLQNVPKPDPDSSEDLEEAASVRRCFIPPAGQCLFMPDFDQMEYRLMLDQAEEMHVIKLILDGLDVHEATAQTMSVTRKQAKTINFMLLYGGGAQKLADALGITLEEAKDLKALYFDRLPNVSKWIRGTISIARMFRNNSYYTSTWYGRLFEMNPKFTYRAPNWKIQGGSADICKIAMVNIHELLKNKKTKMRLQVHDELIFSVPEDELYVCPDIIKLMETAYPAKHLPLTVGASHSWISWADSVEGFPSVQAKRSAV